PSAPSSLASSPTRRSSDLDYSAAEPGGTAEKVLERAGDIRNRRKAKRAAKDAGDVVTEAGEALHRPSSRLQFTAEERADGRCRRSEEHTSELQSRFELVCR